MRRELRVRFTIHLLCLSIVAFFPLQMVGAQQQQPKVLRFVHSPGYTLQASSKNEVANQLNQLYNDADPDTEGYQAPVKPNFNIIVDSTTVSGSKDTRDKTLPISAQTSGIKADVNQAMAANPDNLILFGQSQGGIRVREFLQSQATDDQREAVKGLATISSPNTGGPVLNNGANILRREAFILSNSATVANVPVAIVLGGTINGIVDDYLGPKNPGVTDMKVGSDLLKKLNNTPSRQCYTRTYYVTKRFLWYKWKEARRYRFCRKIANPDHKPIPADTAVMSIVTGNSDPDAMIHAQGGPSKGGRIALGVFATSMAAATWAIAWMPWNWWLVPVAIAFTGVAQLVFRLPSIYNQVMGSSQHDGLFPKKNQVIPRSAGGRWHEERLLPDALHDYGYDKDNPSKIKGALGLYADQTARHLRDLELEAR